MKAPCLAPRLAPCTVPPELRRLRDAWAWARGQMMTIDFMGADTPDLREYRNLGGEHLHGTSDNGDSLLVYLTDDEIHVVRSGPPDQDTTEITLRLPARLRRGVPGLFATPSETELAK